MNIWEKRQQISSRYQKYRPIFTTARKNMFDTINGHRDLNSKYVYILICNAWALWSWLQIK